MACLAHGGRASGERGLWLGARREGSASSLGEINRESTELELKLLAARKYLGALSLPKVTLKVVFSRFGTRKGAKK